MMTDLRELYQEVIIDHGRRPRNFGILTDANYHEEGFNPLCGDKILLYIKENNSVLEKLQFEGVGCAISMASASLLTETLQGKTVNEALEIFTDFSQFITDKIFSDRLGKLAILGGVTQFPARVKCATLAWHTLKAILDKNKKNSKIDLTRSAESHILSMLEKDKKSIGFRLSIKKTGCSGFAYVPTLIEKVTPTDIYFKTQNGLKVYIDCDILAFVSGLLIDYKDDEANLNIKQKRLFFINPHEKNRCGCGESFTIE